MLAPLGRRVATSHDAAMADTTTDDRPEATGPAASGASRWTDLATFGFLMAALGPLLMIAAILGWGMDGEDAVFFLVALALALVGAALVRRPRASWRVVAVVLSVAVGMMLFWTAFGLAAPQSFFDFVPGLLVLPGALIALVAGIGSIRAMKRDTAPGGERRVIGALAGALGLFAIVSAVLTVTGKETVSDEERAGADVVVTLSDFEFDEAGYDTPGGSTILVRNDDPWLHTFTIDALDIDVSLNPGSEKLIEVPAEPGTYVLYCSPHTSDPDDPAEDDMASQLTVG
jgi:plastocyanin